MSLKINSVLLKKKAQKYKKERPSRCPYCRGLDLIFLPPYLDLKLNITIQVSCQKCGRYYDEVYKLTKIQLY